MSTGWRAGATVGVALAFVVVAGLLLGAPGTRVEDGAGGTVSVCDDLDGYDFERAMARVERIKGVELASNVSVCTERYANGIDTTPARDRFAHVEAAGLAFFELNGTPEDRRRSSLGHISFELGGDEVSVVLASERAVANASWISYEGVVAHEFSDAVYAASLSERANASDGRRREPTTDYVLAQQAYANGVSLHVAKLYVREYGGHLNATALRANDTNWRRQLLKSAYYRGYEYGSQRDARNHASTAEVTTTAQILHPERDVRAASRPDRPNLSMENVEHRRADSVGELFVGQTLRAKGVPPRTAARAADGWTADRMDYYRTGGADLVTWRVVWRDEAEREEFLAAYESVYDFAAVDSVQDINCAGPGRFLTAQENVVTVVQCP